MLRVAAATLLLSLLGSPALSAQGGAPQLGRIDFPASGSPEAHREFVTGVLWMHSFEYSRAAAAFQRAQRLDPDFAMAYWGEAMTHTHPVWNEQDLDAARAILQRLAAGPETRRGKAATAREQLYLDAVEALYGAGGKEVRDTLYSQAMERLVRAHPEDLEAKAFYSLSLIGLSQGVRDTTTYRRASAWADTVFAANPEHPGAAHYLIHAWDDPGHAPLGLAAAHAYSGIAPDAAHAQHMTTHIFLAMGMWEEVVARNTVAMGLTARIPGHYTSWLHYGLLQQGRLAEATAFLEEMRENMESQRLQREGVLAWMRLAHVLSTDAWDSGPALWSIDVTGLPATGQAPELYFRGLSGYRLQDRNTLDSARTALAVTLSLGERPEGDLAAWKKAGADRYLMRFETSNRALFSKIHADFGKRPSDRIAQLKRMRELGYEIGSGIMAGIPGQTFADLVNDLETFRTLDLDMIGIGPYLPHPATPLGRDAVGIFADTTDQVPTGELITLKLVALTRLVCPRANIPSTTALATINKQHGRELGLQRGANIVMPNLTPVRYRALYEIYPSKACIDETAEQCHACLGGRIRSIGRIPGQGPGSAINRNVGASA